MPRTRTPDVTVQNEFTIFLVKPETDRARAWIEENVQEGAQYWCGALVVEHRFVENLIAGMQSDGLEVS